MRHAGPMDRLPIRRRKTDVSILPRRKETIDLNQDRTCGVTDARYTLSQHLSSPLRFPRITTLPLNGLSTGPALSGIELTKLNSNI